MKLKKFYEPAQLAAWHVKLQRRAADIERALVKSGVADADKKALALARDDKEIEAARQQIRVTHVEVMHTGKDEVQIWSSRCVEEWVEHGWMRMDGDHIVVKTAEHQPNLRYMILRRPGYHCTSTGERIPLSDLALTQYMTKTVATLAPQEARAWLVAHGKEPSDYTASRSYECTLDPELHAVFTSRKLQEA